MKLNYLKMENLFEILILIVIFIGMMFLAEVGAYFWHRLAHVMPPIKQTHDIHHRIIDDQAHQDFLYILGILIIYLITLSWLYYKEKLSLKYLLVLYIPVLLVSIWNWYIHAAYHIENHWLNSYEWFKQDKRIHMQHHRNEATNYSIASHFSDIIFETFDYGFPCSVETNNEIDS